MLAEQHPLAGRCDDVVFGFVALVVFAIGNQIVLEQLGHAFSAADHAIEFIHLFGGESAFGKSVRTLDRGLSCQLKNGKVHRVEFDDVRGRHKASRVRSGAGSVFNDEIKQCCRVFHTPEMNG